MCFILTLRTNKYTNGTMSTRQHSSLSTSSQSGSALQSSIIGNVPTPATAAAGEFFL